MNPQLLSMLKQNPATTGGAAETASVAVAEAPETGKSRRRLGRTLDDIRNDKS
ncbi:MAG: hypothetical protein QM775_26340 [Pirellulales bacterium]